MRLACQYLAHVICSCIRRTCSVAPFPRPQRRECLLASHNLGRGAGRRRLIACGCCVGEALWTAPHHPLLASSDACRLLIEWSIDRVVCSTNPLIFLVGWKFGCVRAQTKLPAVPATSPGIIFFYSFDGWWEFFTRASIDLGIYCFKIQVISSAISLANITQVLKSLEKIKNW